MIDEKKLIEEIADFKRCQKSENCDYLTGYISALSAVEGIISELPKVGEWIPCSERLPSKKGTYLVTVKLFGVTFGRFTGQRNDLHFDSNVIAWQPLPQPYRE